MFNVSLPIYTPIKPYAMLFINTSIPSTAAWCTPNHFYIVVQSM